jgi:proteasome accessory factor A
MWWALSHLGDVSHETHQNVVIAGVRSGGSPTSASLRRPTYPRAMTVRRVMGIETEYGVSVPGHPTANAMLTSSQVVNAYAAQAASRARRARWDFEEESPLRDARGFDLSRDIADPSQLTDEDLGLANTILTNGARLYVDHAHPEYSSPEVTNPRDGVLWDKAGERVMAEAGRRAAAVPGVPPINLYKNNTDNKGASYGCHENYLMRRETPFADIVRHLTPFFVSRQVVCGAGRVGIGQDGSAAGFQVSQRADYFEVEVGLETTLKRPIINTRDEPHAVAEKYRRLHVIIGDANMSEISTYLKLGTTSLVLAMIEDGFLTVDLSVDKPVKTLHAVSHDPTLSHLVTLRSGRRLTAVQLQMDYLEQARKYVEDRFGDDADEQTRDVLDRWESVLTRLERDPMLLARELDWVAKLELLEGFRSRDGLDWSSARLQAVDLQWSDVRPDKGLYNRLAARGRMQRLLDESEIEQAVTEPPEDTRAYFRGQCLARYADDIAAASWDSVIFDLAGRESLQRVPTLEPLRGTRAHVGELLDRCATAEELVRAITGG